jgi:hypothetical protein
LSIGPEKSVFYIFFIIIDVIFYFIFRSIIYGYYREYLHYKKLKEIKNNSKNKFKKITGLYLLDVKKGKNIFLKILLVLVNIQIIFIPLLLIVYLISILGVYNIIREGTVIVDVLCKNILTICLLISIHYILKIRFKK